MRQVLIGISLGILVLLVACESAAARSAKSNPAPVGEVMQVQGTQANPDSSTQVPENYDQLVVTVEAMGELVAELWERVEALEVPMQTFSSIGQGWVEQDAIAVVKRELVDLLRGCNREHIQSLLPEVCISTGELSTHPLGKAIDLRGVRPIFRSGALQNIQRDIEWTGIYEQESHGWKVKGARGAEYMLFHVDERTGIVEGIDSLLGTWKIETDRKTAEQLLEDILKEAN